MHYLIRRLPIKDEILAAYSNPKFVKKDEELK